MVKLIHVYYYKDAQHIPFILKESNLYNFGFKLNHILMDQYILME